MLQVLLAAAVIVAATSLYLQSRADALGEDLSEKCPRKKSRAKKAEPSTSNIPEDPKNSQATSDTPVENDTCSKNTQSGTPDGSNEEVNKAGLPNHTDNENGKTAAAADKAATNASPGQVIIIPSMMCHGMQPVFVQDTGQFYRQPPAKSASPKTPVFTAAEKSSSTTTLSPSPGTETPPKTDLKKNKKSKKRDGDKKKRRRKPGMKPSKEITREELEEQQAALKVHNLKLAFETEKQKLESDAVATAAAVVEQQEKHPSLMLPPSTSGNVYLVASKPHHPAQPKGATKHKLPPSPSPESIPKPPSSLNSVSAKAIVLPVQEQQPQQSPPGTQPPPLEQQ